jgi:hypothetical protein
MVYLSIADVRGSGHRGGWDNVDSGGGGSEGSGSHRRVGPQHGQGGSIPPSTTRRCSRTAEPDTTVGLDALEALVVGDDESTMYR